MREVPFLVIKKIKEALVLLTNYPYFVYMQTLTTVGRKNPKGLWLAAILWMLFISGVVIKIEVSKSISFIKNDVKHYVKLIKRTEKDRVEAQDDYNRE